MSTRIPDKESEYESEASSISPNEVLIDFQCLNCFAKYGLLYDLNLVHVEFEYCPKCGSRSARRLDTNEEACETNN